MAVRVTGPAGFAVAAGRLRAAPPRRTAAASAGQFISGCQTAVVAVGRRRPARRDRHLHRDRHRDGRRRQRHRPRASSCRAWRRRHWLAPPSLTGTAQVGRTADAVGRRVRQRARVRGDGLPAGARRRRDARAHGRPDRGYAVDRADVGATIVGRLVAANAAGTVTADTPASAVVLPAPPVGRRADDRGPARRGRPAADGRPRRLGQRRRARPPGRDRDPLVRVRRPRARWSAGTPATCPARTTSAAPCWPRWTSRTPPARPPATSARSAAVVAGRARVPGAAGRGRDRAGGGDPDGDDARDRRPRRRGDGGDGLVRAAATPASRAALRRWQGRRHAPDRRGGARAAAPGARARLRRRRQRSFRGRPRPSRCSAATSACWWRPGGSRPASARLARHASRPGSTARRVVAGRAALVHGPADGHGRRPAARPRHASCTAAAPSSRPSTAAGNFALPRHAGAVGADHRQRPDRRAQRAARARRGRGARGAACCARDSPSGATWRAPSATSASPAPPSRGRRWPRSGCCSRDARRRAAWSA